jgi:hypothetical protein
MMRPISLLALLMINACGAPGVPDATDQASAGLEPLPGEALPPPTLSVSATMVLAGESIILDVTGVPAGARVTFLAGASLGQGPCPPVLRGTCVDIRNPRVIDTVTADVLGRGATLFTVPAGLSLDLLYVQAAVVLPSQVLTFGPVPIEIVRGDGDLDDDGLTLAQESNLGTDPLNPDSDFDGIVDGIEVALGTDPLWWDSDLDGLSDADELRIGTDPNRVDSDRDGLIDSFELSFGTDPLLADTDGDGVLDGLEVQVYGTDPLRSDTDRDGISDLEEIYDAWDTDPDQPQDTWRPGDDPVDTFDAIDTGSPVDTFDRNGDDRDTDVVDTGRSAGLDTFRDVDTDSVRDTFDTEVQGVADTGW